MTRRVLPFFIAVACLIGARPATAEKLCLPPNTADASTVQKLREALPDGSKLSSISVKSDEIELTFLMPHGNKHLVRLVQQGHPDAAFTGSHFSILADNGGDMLIALARAVEIAFPSSPWVRCDSNELTVAEPNRPIGPPVWFVMVLTGIQVGLIALATAMAFRTRP